jgi:ribosomal protein S18 acetylase RimI-like enzyme
LFNPGRWQIITAEDRDIGKIDIECRPGEIYLARVEIDPGYQGRGIGGRLVGALLHQARQQGQDLMLDVLVINHRARALYQRLGLVEEARHGEGGGSACVLPRRADSFASSSWFLWRAFH